MKAKQKARERIPEVRNCWIVSSILFERFEDPKSEYSSVPSTLTELYQAVITHLDEHHFRASDEEISGVAIKNLQQLAHDGIQHGQFVFSDEIFVGQMRKSGLVNKLSNPYSQAQQQFYFVHLTIQEFLAAKHVTETYTPEEINEFVTSHFSCGKWYLVLQFIAGLLGEKITKLFQRDYSDCVLTFAKCLIVKNGKLELTDDISLRVIKCLGEVRDEKLIEKCAETTAMNDVIDLSYELVHDSVSLLPLSLSDWDKVTLLCKHMKNLKALELTCTVLYVEHERIVDVTKLLEQRCFKKLKIHSSNNLFVIFRRDALSALLKSSCTMDNNDNKLTELHISSLIIYPDTSSELSNFFEEGRVHNLEALSLASCLFRPDISMPLLKALTNKHCPKLTYLNLSGNLFSHEDLKTICGQRLSNLSQLYLDGCCLLEECIPPICELLTDERCNLTHLSLQLNRNDLSPGSLDGRVKKICRVLQNEHCKLVMLNLEQNKLTDQCIPDLCNALQNKHCKLSALSLAQNEDITDEGLRMLCECSLPEGQEKKKLNLLGCSLTKNCIPYLRDAVENEHFILKELTLAKSMFSKEERELLHQLETNQMKFELVIV